MDVNPVVGENVRLINNQANRQKIAVFETLRRRDDIGRRRGIEPADKLGQRHRRDDVRCGDVLGLAAAIDGYAGDAHAITMNGLNASFHAHFAAAPRDGFGADFPKHSRSAAGIVELLNERRDLAVLGLPDRADDGALQREVLDPLRRPLGLKFLGADAPDLFGVSLEKRPKQSTTKAIDHPLLKRVFLLVRKNAPAAIAGHEPHALVDAQVFEGVAGLERIVEELLVVEDAAQAGPAHELLAPFGQNLDPQRLDFFAFGKEAMPAHVKAVPLVRLGATDAAHDAVSLQNQRLAVVAGQLKARSQPRRAGANDDESLLGIRFIRYR